ncbi:MAG: FG-GAP repeat protein [Bdellovibrionales bacterium]|nr:FG-GAP repeat protein [Bdellovibrionales bacterium]
MRKWILILITISLQGCLGPVVGENTQPLTAELVSWNITEGEGLFGTKQIKITLNTDEAISRNTTMALTLNGQAFDDQNPASRIFETSVNTLQPPWQEGDLVKLTLKINHRGEALVFEREAHINNITFENRKFLDRSPLGALSSVDAQGWLHGAIESAGDINQDGLDDLLVLDGYRPYIRLSSTDLEQNYRTIWEVSDEDWMSAKACDVNGDGHKDIVLGNPNRHDLKGGIKVFFGPMTATKTFAFTREVIGDSNRYTGSRVNLFGMVGSYDQTISDGIGLNLSCRKTVNLMHVVHFTGEPQGFSHISNSIFQPFSNHNQNLRFISYSSISNDLIIDSDSGAHFITRSSFLSDGFDYNSDGYEDIVFTNLFSTVDSPSAYLYDDPTANEPYIFTSLYKGDSNGRLVLSGKDKVLSHAVVVYKPFKFLKLASLGDLNQDKYSDVAISTISWILDPDGYAYLAQNPSTEAIKPSVKIYFGGSVFPGETLEILHPLNASKTTRFGENVVAADFNLDGFVDLAISAPGYDASEHPEGEVFVFYGPGFSRYDRYLTQFGTSNAWMGHRMMALDYNQDGKKDLITSIWGGFEAGVPWFGQLEVLHD